jgi:hypothetical protein
MRLTHEAFGKRVLRFTPLADYYVITWWAGMTVTNGAARAMRAVRNQFVNSATVRAGEGSANRTSDERDDCESDELTPRAAFRSRVRHDRQCDVRSTRLIVEKCLRCRVRLGVGRDRIASVGVGVKERGVAAGNLNADPMSWQEIAIPRGSRGIEGRHPHLRPRVASGHDATISAPLAPNATPAGVGDRQSQRATFTTFCANEATT